MKKEKKLMREISDLLPRLECDRPTEHCIFCDHEGRCRRIAQAKKDADSILYKGE